MASHRIKKYSRQVVSQDCILSCQANTIHEIPFLRRAKVSSLSLQDQNQNAGTGRLPLLERDLNLSGMLMCWHLLKSRSMPRVATWKRAEIHHRTTVRKRERACHSLLTLRDQTLHMAIEKYLLFLMPREMRKQRTIEIMSSNLLSRRDRFHLSMLYVYTALGLCQYRASGAPLKGIASDQTDRATLALATERISFPFLHSRAQHVSLALQALQCLSSNVDSKAWSKNEGTSTIDPKIVSCREHTFLNCSLGKPAHDKQKSPQSERAGLRIYDQNRFQVFSYPTLSLYCPSLLSSPDIQDVAQSGLLTLEGSLTLELF